MKSIHRFTEAAESDATHSFEFVLSESDSTNQGRGGGGQRLALDFDSMSEFLCGWDLLQKLFVTA